jgi:REP element-mobilizing transposase RayT
MKENNKVRYFVRKEKKKLFMVWRLRFERFDYRWNNRNVWEPSLFNNNPNDFEIKNITGMLVEIPEAEVALLL